MDRLFQHVTSVVSSEERTVEVRVLKRLVVTLLAVPVPQSTEQRSRDRQLKLRTAFT